MKKYLPILLLAGALIFSACGTNKINEETENTNLITTSIKETENINLATAPIVTGKYLIDTENSRLNWHAEKFIGNSHDGDVKIKGGEISFNNDTNNGSIIVDMTTISDDKNTEPLIKHLKGVDFFDVEKFPESKIELTKIIQKNDNPNQYEISGNLTIKDKTNPITFDANTINSDGLVTLTGNFSIDRTIWDIKFGSNKFFDNLGDQAIKDNIDYNFSISAKLIK